jgi:hypothetical protein
VGQHVWKAAVRYSMTRSKIASRMLFNYLQNPQIYKKNKCDGHELCDASLEAFAATKFNKIFLGRERRQNVNFLTTFCELPPSPSTE